MWKRLIVAYDFSTYAQNALSTAIELARSQGASITLVHACELALDLANSPVTLPSGVESTLHSGAFVEHAALVELEKVAAPLRAEGLQIDARATIGRAVDVILAASDSADAIVMGTHGRTGLAHFFLGSVAENVVRRASVPVVTVHAAESQPVVGRAASDAAVSALHLSGT